MEAHDRPPGIVLLTTMHLVSGMSLAAGLVAAAFAPEYARAVAERFSTGNALIIVIATVIVLSVLGIETAAGLWRATTWGWFLGSFWYALAIVRSLITAAVVYFYSQPTSALNDRQVAHDRGYLMGVVMARLLVSVLLYAYFFKSNVRRYFEMTASKLWKAAVVQFTIGVVIIGVLMASAYVAVQKVNHHVNIASLSGSNSERR
jgi:hypothetical protein